MGKWENGEKNGENKRIGQCGGKLNIEHSFVELEVSRFKHLSTNSFDDAERRFVLVLMEALKSSDLEK